MIFEETARTLYCRFDKNVDTTLCSEIAPQLRDRIADAEKRISDLNIVFDMTQTEYISSAFLRLCILHGKQVGLSHFRVENVSDEVRHVFEITGLIGILSLR